MNAGFDCSFDFIAGFFHVLQGFFYHIVDAVEMNPAADFGDD